MLKVAGGAASGANGTVTSITAGTGITLTPDPITANGTVALANTAVTAGTYGNANTVAQVTVDAQGRLTNVTNVSISIANSAVTGLGTMSTQNANAVSITGGNINVTNVTATTAVLSNTFQALNSSGGALKNASGASQLQWGGGGGNNLSLDVATNINPANSAVNISPTGSGTVTINPAGGGSATLTNISAANVTITSTLTANLTTNANATFATSSLLLVPEGYLVVNINGTNKKIPYYAT